MSDPGDLPKGKHQKYPQRKRTIFTQKQLADLRLLFNENPYPTSSLQREMASKMEIHPTVVKVWFKNHRAKLKRAKYKPIQQKQQEAQQQQLAEAGGKASSSKTGADTPPRSPRGALPPSLVYTEHPVPAFQLRLCPNFNAHTDHFVGHKIVHFGCCRDPNIYCLSPTLESQVVSTSISANSFCSSSPPRSCQ
ncbi:divergent paired-related homeobox [Equus quagga]|uniref:divergent paired-related homeobox n=1 Tax=Equus quagga TaxID=89248 RepID=UPI001EE35B1C|nr:divergent paired-related homeobox [Equus quagga]